MTIYTYGYGLQGSPCALITMLRRAGEEPYLVRVIDIRRSLAHSRNCHARGGWAGAEWRPRLGNLGKTRKWVRPEGAEDELRILSTMMLHDSRPLCLVCCESDHRRCHRREVAEELARRTGAEVIHL